MRSVSAACVVVMLATGCSGEDEEGRPGQAANTVVLNGQVANDHGSEAVSASGERVTFEAGDFYFEPTVLTGPAGEAVLLQVVSAGQSVHNLTAGEVDQDVAPGESVDVELRFPDSGTLVFVCKYHRERGMAGALVAT
jgi:plastocyanin